jgi:hypothetical protein
MDERKAVRGPDLSLHNKNIVERFLQQLIAANG